MHFTEIRNPKSSPDNQVAARLIGRLKRLTERRKTAAKKTAEPALRGMEPYLAPHRRSLLN